MTQSNVGSKAIDSQALDRWFQRALEPERFKDYCPNGWQVEGKARVGRLACAVTASLAAIEQAVEWGADALLVHHGVFWRGDDPRLVGTHGRRVRAMMEGRLNLWAYHLPLDVHPEWGNNVQLGRAMGWLGAGQAGGACGDDGLVLWSELGQATEAQALARKLQRRLRFKPLIVGDMKRTIRRLGWCTGAAQDFLALAASQGCDAFVSGEISERTTHLARELGVVYFAAGHYATETLGVQALAGEAARHFGLAWTFIEDPNPV